MAQARLCALQGTEELLEAGPGGSLQAVPLLYGHQDRGFRAAPRHHLGAFALARIEELTETRLGVLDGPDGHGALALTG